MISDSPTPLKRLKRAVQRVKLLVSNNLVQWLYHGVAASAGPRRPLRLEEPHGLLDVVSLADGDEFYDAASSSSASHAGSPSSKILDRTMSAVWNEISKNRSSVSEGFSTAGSASPRTDDVNDRTENFIAIFRRHLAMERQISLELRYCKSNSFEAAPPPPPLV